MSNYHVLDMNKEQDRANVVFHITVPNTNNGIGINMRTALSQFKEGPGSAVPWQQSGTEYDAIQAGEVYEYVENYDFGGKITKPQRQEKLDAEYTALSTTVVDKLSAVLASWGFNRDVP